MTQKSNQFFTKQGHLKLEPVKNMVRLMSVFADSYEHLLHNEEANDGLLDDAQDAFLQLIIGSEDEFSQLAEIIDRVESELRRKGEYPALRERIGALLGKFTIIQKVKD